ncbi:hypothetical protein E4T56_gene18500 [Termitomyces sp. T112]|nr:hypothetical protein E4T56_gene18500 [Termitomyces sp. T112]
MILSHLSPQNIEHQPQLGCCRCVVFSPLQYFVYISFRSSLFDSSVFISSQIVVLSSSMINDDSLHQSRAPSPSTSRECHRTHFTIRFPEARSLEQRLIHPIPKARISRR